MTRRASPPSSYERAMISLNILSLPPRPTASLKGPLVTNGVLVPGHGSSNSIPTGYEQRPSHGLQGQGCETCPLPPPPSPLLPSYGRATNCLVSLKPLPRGKAHRFRDARCVHSLPRPATSELCPPVYLDHLQGQASPSMTHLSLDMTQQPVTNFSLHLLGTRKIMVSHGRPGKFRSCPRSRRRWRSSLRSHFR